MRAFHAVLFALAVAWAVPAAAHAGGLNKCGCHFDRKAGGGTETEPVLPNAPARSKKVRARADEDNLHAVSDRRRRSRRQPHRTTRRARAARR